jgi:hypothetical protein
VTTRKSYDDDLEADQKRCLNFIVEGEDDKRRERKEGVEKGEYV